VSRDRYDVLEKMHWVCFHYEFEHDAYASRRLELAVVGVTTWRLEYLRPTVLEKGASVED
jgi:hypothetical protein